MVQRNEYPLKIRLNQRNFSRIVIDQHYKLKHSESIDDNLIIELVKTLNGTELQMDSKKGDFEFFKVEPVEWPQNENKKPYRLILTLCIFDDFVGVVNAFRINE